MADHDIPARPDTVTGNLHGNRPGRSTLADYRAELDVAGITPGDLRTWARDQGIEVPLTGLPPRHVLRTYLAAHQPDEPTAPHPDETPALADLLGRARALIADLDGALSRLVLEGRDS